MPVSRAGIFSVFPQKQDDDARSESEGSERPEKGLRVVHI